MSNKTKYTPLSPSKPTLEEEIGDLRIQFRNLKLRVERLEQHTHGKGRDSLPTIQLTLLHDLP